MNTIGDIGKIGIAIYGIIVEMCQNDYILWIKWPVHGKIAYVSTQN